MNTKSYKNLIVWNKSIELVAEIYKITELFPKSEIFGLTSQMRRAAVSIPSNIAEGSKRGTQKDYRHFLLTAFGSGGELETQFTIIKILPFGKKINCENAEKLLDEVMRMLNCFISKLQAN